MREYEKHQDANGQPPSHQFAKELMAGVAGAEVSFCHQHIVLQNSVLLLNIYLCGGKSCTCTQVQSFSCSEYLHSASSRPQIPHSCHQGCNSTQLPVRQMYMHRADLFDTRVP